MYVPLACRLCPLPAKLLPCLTQFLLSLCTKYWPPSVDFRSLYCSYTMQWHWGVFHSRGLFLSFYLEESAQSSEALVTTAVVAKSTVWKLDIAHLVEYMVYPMQGLNLSSWHHMAVPCTAPEATSWIMEWYCGVCSLCPFCPLLPVCFPSKHLSKVQGAKERVHWRRWDRTGAKLQPQVKPSNLVFPLVFFFVITKLMCHFRKYLKTCL